MQYGNCHSDPNCLKTLGQAAVDLNNEKFILISISSKLFLKIALRDLDLLFISFNFLYAVIVLENF